VRAPDSGCARKQHAGDSLVHLWSTPPALYGCPRAPPRRATHAPAPPLVLAVPPAPTPLPPRPPTTLGRARHARLGGVLAACCSCLGTPPRMEPAEQLMRAANAKADDGVGYALGVAGGALLDEMNSSGPSDAHDRTRRWAVRMRRTHRLTLTSTPTKKTTLRMSANRRRSPIRCCVRCWSAMHVALLRYSSWGAAGKAGRGVVAGLCTWRRAVGRSRWFGCYSVAVVARTARQTSTATRRYTSRRGLGTSPLRGCSSDPCTTTPSSTLV